MSLGTKQDVYSRIQNGFEEMTRLGIVIAPWLAIDDGEKRLSDKLRIQLKEHARNLSISYRDSEVFWLNIDLTPEFLKRAFYEVLLSTAAYLSYMRLGTLVITEEMVSVSHLLLQSYMKDNGSTSLLSIYARVLTYLNTQLVLHYGQVSEETFISGKWHRPWIDYSLEHELTSAIHYGFMERVKSGDSTFVRLTQAGKQLYKDCRDDLDRCGYIKQREQLMRAANFTNMDEYEKIMDRSSPEVHALRKKLLEWSEIDSGMDVLELGCGTGALTLDDGLYQFIGEHGHIIATDPSLGMLERAKMKLQDYNVTNVEFKQAVAEKLPFPDDSFDVVLGIYFLHFTDIPKAFEEIRRVLKPNGKFITFYSLDFPKNIEFFLEWFQPLFAKELTGSTHSTFPDSSYVASIAAEYFRDFKVIDYKFTMNFSEVEYVVKFLIQAGTMAQLTELPWEARTKLFHELIESGYQVKRKYGAKSMQYFHPGQWFKGSVKK